MMETVIYTDEQREQFFELLATYPHEVAGLRAALVEGRINGNAYWITHQRCGCVLGTIAHLCGITERDIFLFDPFELSEIERLALSIKRGDTPDTNSISALLVSWIDEAAQS